MAAADANWYVVHTYSGYENKVKANIEKAIENRNMQDRILEVSVPLQNVVEFKDGSKKEVQKKMFPGYVLIRMVMDDDTWYVVRNTRDGKVEGIKFKVTGADNYSKTVTTNAKGEIQIDDLKVGTYTVTEVTEERYEDQKAQTVKVGIDMFGKETIVELDFTDVKSEN